MVICHRDSKTYYFQCDRPTPKGPRTTRVKIDRTDRVTLKDAWERAEALRADLRKGIHPKERPEAPSAIEQARNTFTLRDAVKLHWTIAPKCALRKPSATTARFSIRTC